MAPPIAPASTDERTSISEVIEQLVPGRTWEECLVWPPDVFALTASLLGRSGAYRYVVSPPEGKQWPPGKPGTWAKGVYRSADQWRRWALDPSKQQPAFLRNFGRQVSRAIAAPMRVAHLNDADNWTTLVAILTLMAVSDEACAGAGVPSTSLVPKDPFEFLTSRLFASTGSLATIERERARVLPKLRPPQTGITLRSMSRHAALDTTEVQTDWQIVPQMSLWSEDRFNLLLLPWPDVVHPLDFERCGGSVDMDPRYGFFRFSPHGKIDPTYVASCIKRAKDRVGLVDAVVLPEGALSREDIPPLEEALLSEGVYYLIAGVGDSAMGTSEFGRNYLHLGSWRPDVGTWDHFEQNKHHRWCLDGSQIRQYHLGAALHPARDWWEAIEVTKRTLTLLSVFPWLTICPLICEDLARVDPVADLIRTVGPSLVVAILLDGPQLSTRWPGRYASVLADDPGSAVLTLTCVGMAERSRPEGHEPSRVVALWKDARHGAREIRLERDSRGLLLTVCGRQTSVMTADGRSHVGTIVELAGIEQVE